MKKAKPKQPIEYMEMAYQEMLKSVPDNERDLSLDGISFGCTSITCAGFAGAVSLSGQEN